MERLSRSIEKRSFQRSTVSLPIEYRKVDELHPWGGLIENISEMGLRVLSVRPMAIGAELSIAVLFVNGYVPSAKTSFTQKCQNIVYS